MCHRGVTRLLGHDCRGFPKRKVRVSAQRPGNGHRMVRSTGTSQSGFYADSGVSGTALDGHYKQRQWEGEDVLVDEDEVRFWPLWH